MPRGRFHRGNDAQRQREQDDAGDGDMSRQCQRGQRRRLNHCERAGYDEHRTAVVPVRDHSGEWSDEENRPLGNESHQPEQKNRMGQAVNEPTERDRLHPGPQQRDGLARKEQAVIAVMKRARQVRDPGRICRPPGRRISFQCHSRLWRQCQNRIWRAMLIMKLVVDPSSSPQ